MSKKREVSKKIKNGNYTMGELFTEMVGCSECGRYDQIDAEPYRQAVKQLRLEGKVAIGLDHELEWVEDE